MDPMGLGDLCVLSPYDREWICFRDSITVKTSPYAVYTWYADIWIYIYIYV